MNNIDVNVKAVTTPPDVTVQYKTIILKKHLVNGVNTLTQEMMSTTNTKYVIKYDYVLNGDITVPENCILEFDGGSFNGGNVWLNDITCYGNYYGENINYINKIIINKGCTLNNFKLNGYIWISTTEKVILNNCEIYRDNQNVIDFLINIDADNANLEITNSKIHCNSSVTYGIYTCHQLESLVVSNCEFYGIREIAINCSNRILFCLIEGNHIHNIGIADTLLVNSIGVRINGNLSDSNPDYTLYDGMSIVVRDNIIEHLISNYTIQDDACEGHGILIYGNNVVIENNVVKDLLAGSDNEHLTIYCGSEHEGIYVKGDYCTIINNTLINACGNYGSEGAIAVKWNGLGGTICNNKIIQSFGNGIWTQCRNVRISDNYICYKQDENAQNLPVARYYCVYNTVDTAYFIPIHTERKYTSIVENNNIELRDVLNYDGFVFSFDGGSDDILINGNKVECTGFTQILRSVGGGKNTEKEKYISFNNNVIRKPFPINTGTGILQYDIQVNTDNSVDASDTIVSVESNRFMYYKKNNVNHAGAVIRNYSDSGNLIFKICNNTFESPDKVTSRINADFMEINDSIKEIEFCDNIFDIYLYDIFISRAANTTTNLYVRNNQIGVVSTMVALPALSGGGVSKLNNLIITGNTYDRSSSSTMDLLAIDDIFDLGQHGRLLQDLIVVGNIYSVCVISQNANYAYAIGGDGVFKNNIPSTLNVE